MPSLRDLMSARLDAPAPSADRLRAPGMAVPGPGLTDDDWFAQQGAPSGGGAPTAPGAGGGQYEVDPSTGYYYPGNRIMPDGSAWMIGIDQAHSRQVAPAGSFDPQSGTGINNPPRPTGGPVNAPGGTPTLTTPGGPAGPPVGGGGAAPAGGRMSNADAQAFFDQLFPGERVTPEQLEAHRGELEAAGFTLNPNAAGRITDLTLPSGDTVDPIYGAGSGENRKQWIVHAAGAGGGIGAGLENTPGYQFRLGEGLKALERSAASRGTLLTGGTLKGLQRYAQDVASTEYGNRVNQLMGLSNLGMGAAGTQAQLGSNYAGQAGNLLSNQAGNLGTLITGQGNAQSAGTIGAGNAWQQGLGGIANLAQMYYLSRLMGGGGPAPGGGPTLTQWHG